MQSRITLVVAMLFLGACSPMTLFTTRTKLVAITPPDNLFICPKVDYPPGDFDANQVADLIARFAQSNKICANSLDEIKQYIEAEKKLVEQNTIDNKAMYQKPN